MKKVLFAALAAVLTMSCSQDQILNENPSLNQAIEFSTYTGNTAQTKGTIMDNTQIHTDLFGITAFFTGETAWTAWTKTAPNFMYNQELTYSDSYWLYSPIKYWPTMDNDMISFFAYAPYATGGSEHGITLPAADAATGVTSLNFTIADDPVDMIDFIAANAIDESQNQETLGGRYAVVFNFYHELSRLTFKVKSSDDLLSDTHIVLKSAELVADGKLYKSATYTWSNVEGEPGTWSDKIAMDANYDIWSCVNKSTVTIGALPTDGGKTDYTQADAVDITTETEISLFNTGQYLFLIPETKKNGTGTSAGGLKMKFTYDIVTPDASLAKGYSITSETKTVDLPSGLLKQSAAYIITFTFAMDKIEFEARVDAWNMATTGSVNVPFTPDGQ